MPSIRRFSFSVWRILFRRSPGAGLLPLLMAACSLVAPGSSTATLPVTPAPPTPRQATPTASPAPPTATPSLVPAGPAPEPFSTRELRPGIEPVAYLDDACAYFQRRWDPDRSPPGTVVLPIMFHSIREPSNMPDDSVTISTEYLAAIVQRARDLGFETITAAQLADFLTENARIPRRSMILIMDDRYPGALADYLMPALQANDWTVTLGWIIGDTRADLWSFMENLAGTGRLDVQSHGFQHRYITEAMSDDEMRQEIASSIPILETHFGSRPIAFIWPGGNFTPRAVEIARDEGFQLGFTASSRGPLLFNWVPLGEAERVLDDPLMVLPRAWSTAAVVNLDQAARIGDAAAEQARLAFPAEAAWYGRACSGQLAAP